MVVLILLYNLGTGVVYSQNASTFTNRKLENIAAQLSSLYSFHCNAPQTRTLPSLCYDNPVIVTADPFRTINHIGLKLFDRAIVEGNPSPVYNFVERLFLEILLLKNDAEIKKYLSESKVILRGNGSLQQNIAKGLLRVLAEITPEQSVFITTDNNRYTVSWLRQGKPILSVRFPIQYELLWGMNKAEAENRFYSDIVFFKNKVTRSESPELPEPESLVPMGDSCYCVVGDFYGIEAVTSNRYYRRFPDGGFRPLADVQHPIEAITNLFTVEANFQAGIDQQIVADITQKMYGGRKNEFRLPLNQLVAFCKTSGCEAYVGIESKEDNLLRGVVIMTNRSLGYNHLFYFNTDVRILAQPAKYTLNIQLYAFVPMHNVNNLYNDKFINSKAK